MSPTAARPAAPRAECSEADFQAFVCDCLGVMGWTYHHETDSRKSPSGFPDLVAAHPTRGLLLAELKRERGRVRPEQETWLSALSAAIGGGQDAMLGVTAGRRVYVRLWRPSDADDVLRVTGVLELGGGVR